MRIIQTTSDYAGRQIEDHNATSLSLRDESYVDVYPDIRVPITCLSMSRWWWVTIAVGPGGSTINEEILRRVDDRDYEEKDVYESDRMVEKNIDSVVLSFKSLEATLAFKSALKSQIHMGETTIPIAATQDVQTTATEDSDGPGTVGQTLPLQDQPRLPLERRNSTATMSTISIPPPPYQLS